MSPEIHVKISGSGSFLPGRPIPFDEIERYLGKITEAPPKVMRWMNRIKPRNKASRSPERSAPNQSGLARRRLKRSDALSHI